MYSRSKWAGGRFVLATALAGLSGAALAGVITGGLAFPGETIPALTVVAVEQSGKQFSVETKPGQRSYRLDVPQGS